MSHIILARSVKLYLQPSFLAHIIAFSLLAVLVWAILVSPIPLVVSIVMFALLFSYPLLSWIPASLQGEVDIDCSGKLRVGEQDFFFQQVDFLYQPIFLRIQGRGKCWLLWRDSCHENDYRQLLVKLKREQYCSR
ncbi:hypothetical protein EXA18_03190 [Vibrio cincinnatiensis]|uniref:protein YgfX n=1 Tax=Vibrio cincinnatiensis TaxID=675 RepID=UPI001EE061B9|nr:protein YgfX [Vibrio cincinnatiensis]MCG3742487.1 hypothetical protein [Vibrio cincinnatiensis]